jgi:hypothetical protein
MTAESSSKSAADAESDTPPARWTRRLRRVPLRLVLVVAALFTALTFLAAAPGWCWARSRRSAPSTDTTGLPSTRTTGMVRARCPVARTESRVADRTVEVVLDATSEAAFG